MAPVVLDDGSDEDDEVREVYREFQDTEDAGIPITIVMLVILGYVAVGALLFCSWETDWTPIDGAYFAVITISTIGFGDLVPGNGRFDKVAKSIQNNQPRCSESKEVEAKITTNSIGEIVKLNCKYKVYKLVS